MGARLVQEKGIYKVGLRYGGKLYKRSLKTRKEKQAQTELQKVRSNLHYLELGLIRKGRTPSSSCGATAGAPLSKPSRWNG